MKQPIRPSFRFKVVYPNGYTSDLETRKDVPAVTPAAWKAAALKHLDQLREDIAAFKIEEPS